MSPTLTLAILTGHYSLSPFATAPQSSSSSSTRQKPSFYPAFRPQGQISTASVCRHLKANHVLLTFTHEQTPQAQLLLASDFCLQQCRITPFQTMPVLLEPL
ncbi:unnamed protein product [Protopolystoma xenopodis]|uniref:Uncharacterized protein n=1 Tax=Protopolystoma xenopodis TaxID=117903 RepID=A0A3S5BN42_9PLAT|nr:unnamed protein product [Protopolystoma xenopodis]